MFSDRTFRMAMAEDLDASALYQRLVSWQPPERSAA
jgi:hypothetical protein